MLRQAAPRESRRSRSSIAELSGQEAGARGECDRDRSGHCLERRLELVEGRGALEAVPHDAIAVDHEYPRLAGQVPFVDSFGRLLLLEWVLVDLDVDEVDPVGVPIAQLQHAPELRTAESAGAECRGRERHDEWLLSGLEGIGNAEVV